MASTSPPAGLRPLKPSGRELRTPSGRPIRANVIKAMAEQHAVFAKAHEAADKLVEAVRKIDSVPPKTNGGSRRREPEE